MEIACFESDESICKFATVSELKKYKITNSVNFPFLQLYLTSFVPFDSFIYFIEINNLQKNNVKYWKTKIDNDSTKIMYDISEVYKGKMVKTMKSIVELLEKVAKSKVLNIKGRFLFEKNLQKDIWLIQCENINFHEFKLKPLKKIKTFVEGKISLSMRRNDGYTKRTVKFFKKAIEIPERFFAKTVNFSKASRKVLYLYKNNKNQASSLYYTTNYEKCIKSKLRTITKSKEHKRSRNLNSISVVGKSNLNSSQKFSTNRIYSSYQEMNLLNNTRKFEGKIKIDNIGPLYSHHKKKKIKNLKVLFCHGTGYKGNRLLQLNSKISDSVDYQRNKRKRIHSMIWNNDNGWEVERSDKNKTFMPIFDVIIKKVI